jgi:hypothetical protein
MMKKLRNQPYAPKVGAKRKRERETCIYGVVYRYRKNFSILGLLDYLSVH